jgi:hypothetical protein
MIWLLPGKISVLLLVWQASTVLLAEIMVA